MNIPLSQKELENIINDDAFYYDDPKSGTSPDEDNSGEDSQSQLDAPELDNAINQNFNDEELIGAATEIEEQILNDVMIIPPEISREGVESLTDPSCTHVNQRLEVIGECEEVSQCNIDTYIPGESDEFTISSEEYGTQNNNDMDSCNENQEQGNDTEEIATTKTTTSERKILNRQCLRERYRYYRERGKEYKGYKKENGKFVLVVDRKKRQMLPKCTSKLCINAKNRLCTKFNEKVRQKIFDRFWTMTWDMKKTYVSTLVALKKTKRPTTENSKRTLTFEYHLKKDKEPPLQVCKQTFLNTLGLKEFMVRNWCLKAESGMHVETNDSEVPLRKRITNEMVTSLKSMTDFFNHIPKLESHYCRSSTSKQYVEPIYQNKMDLYRVYKTYCQERNVKPVAPSRFKKEMNDLNIAIHSPKKDQCDVCVGHETGNVDEEAYQSHIKRKNDAREEKADDKNLAEKNSEEIAVLTMDVQAVKLAPFLQASAIYFKTKLCVHNFTIFDLVTKDCHCYLWHEAEGGLEANIFATIIFKHLQNYIDQHPLTKRVILYSDGCGYQNRNNCMANTLLHLAKLRSIIIEQKFLEKGHTQMEVDGAHSLIERKLKNKVIYLPSDYIKFCELARPSQPFTVHYLSHDYFLNFSKVTYYNTIRPGVRRLDPVIADIRCLKYENTEISFKLNYKDDYKLLVNKSKKPTQEITALYKGTLTIKKEKWNHLQALKLVLPKDVHYFYDSLKYHN